MKLQPIKLAMMMLCIGISFLAPVVVADDKLAAPSVDAQAAALKIIREGYRPESAKDVGERKAIAEKMLSDAGDTRDPVARFVMYNEVVRLATNAGDLPTLDHALTALADGYAIDAWSVRITVIRALEKGSQTSQSAKDSAVFTIHAIDLAIAEGNLRAANQVVAIADRLITRSADDLLRTSLRRRQDALRELAAGEAKFAAAEKKLTVTADDAEANLTVGKYVCLLEGNWARGLPLLAKGSDTVLATLAAKDLAMPQVSPASKAGWRPMVGCNR